MAVFSEATIPAGSWFLGPGAFDALRKRDVEPVITRKIAGQTRRCPEGTAPSARLDARAGQSAHGATDLDTLEDRERQGVTQLRQAGAPQHGITDRYRIAVPRRQWRGCATRHQWPQEYRSQRRRQSDRDQELLPPLSGMGVA